MEQKLHSATLHDSACLCGAPLLFRDSTNYFVSTTRFISGYRTIGRGVLSVSSGAGHRVMRLQLTGSSVMKLCGGQAHHTHITHTPTVADHKSLFFFFLSCGCLLIICQTKCVCVCGRMCVCVYACAVVFLFSTW